MGDAFGEGYFDSHYGGRYAERNPPRKMARYLAAALAAHPGGTLLDVGCAYGAFLAVARERYAASGCDISEHAVGQAKARLPGLSIFRSSLEAIPEEATYDVVTCFDVLEHVADLDGAFEKVKRLLNPGGGMVLTVPVYDGAAGLAVRMLDRDETHRWKEGRAFWREKVRAHGFRIVRDEGLWRYPLPFGGYLFFGGTAWRHFSPAILIAAVTA